MLALAKVPIRMTVAEFLKWDSQDDLRYELVDGEPRAMAPASTVHGFLQNELGTLIRNHLREKASGCEVVANPGIVPRLLSEHNVRIPDLAVTCSPLTPGQATLSDPVLVIEILSPSTPQQPGEDLDQCLGVHEHRERSGNPGSPCRSDRSGAAAAFAAGRMARPPDRDRRGRTGAGEHRVSGGPNRALCAHRAGA
jgi:hypothetical protein